MERLRGGGSAEGEPRFVAPDESQLTRTASGLGYAVLQEGRGVRPGPRDVVTVHYAGWRTTGQLFDSSYGRSKPATFRLDQVIPGWTEGVQLMSEGATFTLVIPADLAYGKRGVPPTIGPDETLIFRVELIQVG